MNPFKKNKGHNRLLNLSRAVSQVEAEAFDTKQLIDFLLVEFDKMNLELSHFYVTGPYPNNGWTTKKGFLNGLKKKNYRNIHHLLISDSKDYMFMSFTNWSHNYTIESKYDSIAFSLMVDENFLTNEELVSFGKKLHSVLNFEYGYVFIQSKKFSISEGKIKRGLFTHSESNNPKFTRWLAYDSATKFGFIRSIYQFNFLTKAHFENEYLREVIQNIGKLDDQGDYCVWALSPEEVEMTLNRLSNSPALVENSQFADTEIGKLIQEEVDKFREANKPVI